MNKESRLREEARRYFGQPGFQRFLDELRKRHEASLQGARGYVSLNAMSEEERVTLDGFYGTYISAAELSGKRYSVTGFARLLLESRFALTVPELFELLDGKILMTRGEKRATADAEWNKLINEASAGNDFTGSAYHGKVLDWVESLRYEQASGARILRKLFAAAKADASQCLHHCLQALILLADTHARSADQPAALPIRLPVLAAFSTGDAHALDWKLPAGRLFWWAIVEIYGDGIDRNHHKDDIEEVTEEETALASDPLPRAILIREGYRCAGVADDDVSSQVMVFAPGWLQCWEERILTLRQVERLRAEDFQELQPTFVYAVENPSVFAVLADEAARMNNSENRWDSKRLPMLICVNGQPSVAVIRLLDLLCDCGDSGIPLYYSGDLDMKGLDIAHGLQQRFKSRFIPWRMDLKQYRRYSKRGIPLSDMEREKMKMNVYPWDECLSEEMEIRRMKLHQELWLDELASDWIHSFRSTMRDAFQNDRFFVHYPHYSVLFSFSEPEG